MELTKTGTYETGSEGGQRPATAINQFNLILDLDKKQIFALDLSQTSEVKTVA